MRIPDPQLNYHADRYIAQRISAHGITFERYLSDPAYFDALALQPEPLLPAQRTVAERLDADSSVTIAYDPADGCPHCVDGWIIVCLDDICRGQGWCIHGDGDAICPHCCDD